MTPSKKRAVLLLNLGGPENLDQVQSFLFRLFSDPEIIRIRFQTAAAFRGLAHFHAAG